MFQTIWPYEGASQDVEGKPIVVIISFRCSCLLYSCSVCYRGNVRDVTVGRSACSYSQWVAKRL